MSEEITLAEYLELNKPKHKYFAKRTEVDGIWFGSKREAMRYSDLKIQQLAGHIKNLTLQPVFPIIVNGQKVCEYRGDFSYTYMKTNRPVVEDCKGFRTPVYKLKKKLFEAIYEMEILET